MWNSWSNKMLNQPLTFFTRTDGRLKTKWICHYCNKADHIKPCCFKYLVDLILKKVKKRAPIRQELMVKKIMRCGYNSANHIEQSSWYFDSGYSGHMTGDEKFLINLKESKTQSITFGDGVKGRFVGNGTRNMKGLPQLENVLLVDGLKANLMSISQLCDKYHHVEFTQKECQVFDRGNKCVMEERRSSNNCYLIGLGQQTSQTTSMISKSDEMNL